MSIDKNNIQNDIANYYCPTKIYYRPQGLSLIGSIIKKDYGFSRVMFIYGGNSLKNSGNYNVLISSLKENNILFEEYGGVSPNPDIDDVLKILEICHRLQPELILACGGGSVLDTAKSVANGYYYEGNPLDFNKKIVVPLHALPVATIPTLAASGSEMSDSCVINDRKHHFKNGFNTATNRPLFSLLDPTLTYSVPSYQTAIGLVDMFSHSFERYFSPSHTYEPCDDLALGIMHSIVEVSQAVIENPNGYEERRAMMLCGTLAHNGFTNFGKTMFFPIHQAGHRLSGKHPELLHGQCIALLLLPYLKINKEKLSDKILRLGQTVFSKDCQTAEDALVSLEEWLNSLPLYHSFDELPFVVEKEEIEKANEFMRIK